MAGGDGGKSKGVHGVLVTAVSRKSSARAPWGMLRKRGTMSMMGLPPEAFGLPNFAVVHNAQTVRRPIVGTQQNGREALQFAVEAKVHAGSSQHPLDSIIEVFVSPSTRGPRHSLGTMDTGSWTS